MSSYTTTTVSQPDEEGYCTVTTYEDGVEVETNYVPCDQAGQWAAQEAEVLNESPAERAAYLAPFGPAWAAERVEAGDLPF